jgi:hypothetical protein
MDEEKKRRIKTRDVQKHINNSAEFGSSLHEFQVLQLVENTREREREREYSWHGCDEEVYSALSHLRWQQ